MDICKVIPQSSEWEAVKKIPNRGVFVCNRDNFVTRTILSLFSLTPYVLIISYIFLEEGCTSQIVPPMKEFWQVSNPSKEDTESNI